MTRKTTVLVLIDLVQDLDVLLPILVGMKAAPTLDARVRVSRWLAARAPRTGELLKRHGIAFRYVDRALILRGWLPSLRGVDAVLTASESSASPHRWAHALAGRAVRKAIPAFTVQHGIDNLQVLAEQEPNRRRIASDVLFCWPPQTALPSGLDADTRARLVCVGRPTLPRVEAEPRFDLGVFENLHAAGYTADQRTRWIETLMDLVRLRQDLAVYIQAHPAGSWIDQHADRLAAFGRVTLCRGADARMALSPGAEAPALCRRVITTPSTIALDAAVAGRPVALAMDGGALYAPLPVLDGLNDWLAFADASDAAPQAQAAFLTRHLAPGNAVRGIVERLSTAQGKPVRATALQARG